MYIQPHPKPLRAAEDSLQRAVQLGENMLLCFALQQFRRNK
jgi:hypothetical protein